MARRSPQKAGSVECGSVSTAEDAGVACDMMSGLSDEQRRALIEVVEYLYPEEEKSWHYRGRPADHIFNSILILDQMLNPDPARLRRRCDNVPDAPENAQSRAPQPHD